MRKYQLGGSLPPHNPNYVEREADPYLYEKLKAGAFCYILSARQMGKSSLRVRTMTKLQEKGFPCTVIDLLLFGSSITKKAFYKGVAEEMFRLTEQDKQIFNTWWNSYPSSDYSESKLTLDPPQPERVSYSNPAKLKTFLEEVLLKSVQEKMFIFIDEIDMLLRYKFTHDDFFEFIHYCYQQRPHKPQYNNLNFCLFGVTAPSDLLHNTSNNPFDYCEVIQLSGFTFQKAKEPLIPVLARTVEQPEKVLKEILSQTAGQPYLTQFLCAKVQEEGEKKPDIDDLCRKHFPNPLITNDPQSHFSTIKQRIEHIFQGRMDSEILKKTFIQGKIEYNNSVEQGELLLTGLVVKQSNELILPPLYKLSFQPLLAENIKDLRETDKLGQQRQEATRSGVITKGKGKLTALVPKVKWDEETEIVFGKTISAHPTFFFYLPYEPTTPPKNVKFKLLNEEEHEVYTTFKQFNNLPGVVSISIPETAPPLEVGQNYYWSLYFIHDDKKRSQDDYVSGWVKRVEPSLALKSKLATATTPWELLPFYTEESLWYDALSALALLRRHPYNPSIQEVLGRYPLNPPPSRG